MRKLIAAGILSVALTFSPAPAQTAQAVQQFADLGEFKLVSGQSIRACKLGYRTMGNLNAAKSNAILLPSPFTSQSSDVVDMVSGKKPLFDPSPYFLIFVDTLGDGVSCSPSTSSSQHGAAFPRFTIEDMVEAEHTLVTRTLGAGRGNACVRRSERRPVERGSGARARAHADRGFGTRSRGQSCSGPRVRAACPRANARSPRRLRAYRAVL